MPFYYLHLINVHIDADDSEGHELPTLEAARDMAIQGIRDFLGEELMEGMLDLRGRIDIEDVQGAVLMTVPFEDAVTISNLKVDDRASP